MNYISSNIKYLRIKKGITQIELANVVNKSRVSISQWESNFRGITIEDLTKISNYFNILIDDLIYKDLRFYEDNQDEISLLYDKYKNILTDSDKKIIKVIIEERIKETTNKK